MRARIRRTININAEKTSACMLCGEIKRKNKSLFEAELPCGYTAEIRLCVQCSGIEGNTRTDAIELPFLEPFHFHLDGHKSKTFWDSVDAWSWIKSFMQAPTPVENPDGVWTFSLHKELVVKLCNGTKPSSPEQRVEQ